MVFLTELTRVPPPTISTALSCSFVTPASSSAAAMGGVSRASSGATSSSNLSTLRLIEKSRSSARHSMNMDASVTPAGLSDFFAFSAACCSFIHGLGEPNGFSHLYLAANSSPSHLAMAMSNSRPPRLRSNAVLLTVSLPVTKSTTETEYDEWPRSINIVVCGVVASNRFFALL